MLPFQTFPDLERDDLVEMASAAQLRDARQWMKDGAVQAVTWEQPVLRGKVSVDGKAFEPELNLRSLTFVENRCSCPTGRRGLVCAHALALCLEVERRREEAVGAAVEESRQAPPKPGASATAASSAASGEGWGPKPQAPPPTPPGLQSIKTDPRGKPLGLWVLLPPNFEQAVQRNSVALKIEFQAEGRRVSPEKLFKGQAYAVTPGLEAVLAQLEAMGGGRIYGLFQMQPPVLQAMLLALKSEAVIAWLNAPGKPIHWQGNDLPGVSEHLRNAEDGGRNAEGGGRNAEAGPTSHPSPEASEDAAPEATRGSPVGRKGGRREAAVHQSPPVRRASGAGPSNRASIQVDGSEHFLSFYFSHPSDPVAYPWIERLKSEGFKKEPSNGKFWLRDRYRTLNFLARFLPEMQREPAFRLSDNFVQRTAHIRPAAFTTETRALPSGGFDVGVRLEIGEGSAADLQRALVSNQHFVEAGKTIWLLDPERLRQAAELQQQLTGQQERVLTPDFKTRIQAPLLAMAEEFLEEFDPDFQPPATWKARSGALREIARLEPAPLESDLETTLRPYQRMGAAWLWHLYRHDLGGILADEMGLGKTLQAIALVTAVIGSPEGGGRKKPSDRRQIPDSRFQTKAARAQTPENQKSTTGNQKPATGNQQPTKNNHQPALVVCPASLVENWTREVRRFAPGLRAFRHHGNQRLAEPGAFELLDLVITSYGTLTRDQELFQQVPFGLVLADEAQHVKNRRTQASRALRSLQARGRFVLTGTPIENAVDDLRSLFAFLMPGYLTAIPAGIKRDERQWFDERHLQQTAPYILRRTKDAVAPELPEKIEQTLFCDLSDEQRAMYNRIREDTERKIFEMEMAGAGESKIRFAALTQLLRLRQVCADPRVIEPEFDPKKSAKIGALREILEEALDGNHRVLLFSQFTQVLKLIRPVIEETWGLPTCYLDGATRNRQDVVDRFNNDPSIPVFLISLKAGGVGLNLTGADTVVHFDPWWNPAVEAQATDRAHRIGQTRVVTSLKFIATGTVEEKVLEIQQTKAALLKELFEASDASTAKVSLADIKELIKG